MWWDLTMGDIVWRRGLFQKISTALNLCAYDSGSWILTGIIKAFEYTEYEIQADVMSHSVDGFLGVTISNDTLLCSKYLYTSTSANDVDFVVGRLLYRIFSLFWWYH